MAFRAYLAMLFEKIDLGDFVEKAPDASILSVIQAIICAVFRRKCARIIRAITKKVKPLSLRKIATIIADCFLKAGLVERGPKRRELRAYSLRKYFDTNLAAAGVHRDYIDYMMGHVTPTYNSIKSKGLEFLRRIYAASGLSIKPKMKTSKIDILKEIVRSLGYDPEKVLVNQAFNEPHRTLIRDNTVEILQGARIFRL